MKVSATMTTLQNLTDKMENNQKQLQSLNKYDLDSRAAELQVEYAELDLDFFLNDLKKDVDLGEKSTLSKVVSTLHPSLGLNTRNMFVITSEARLRLLHTIFTHQNNAQLPSPMLSPQQRQQLANDLIDIQDDILDDTQSSDTAIITNTNPNVTVKKKKKKKKKQQRLFGSSVSSLTRYEQGMQYLEHHQSLRPFINDANQRLKQQQQQQNQATTHHRLKHSYLNLISSTASQMFSKESNVPFDWGEKLHQDVFFWRKERSPDYARFSLVATWYYLSPVLFSIYGMYQLQHSDMLKAYVSENWPWEYESYLLILQGLVAFWSDCWDLGLTGISHVADRVMAPALVLWFICRTLLMFMNYDDFGHCTAHQDYFSFANMLLVVTFPTSIWVFLQSVRANKRRDYDRFLLWHGIWHITLPFFGCSYVWLMVTLGDMKVE